MKENKREEANVIKKVKGTLIIVVIVFTLLLIAVVGIFYKGYASAKAKSEEEIAELKAIIERLEDEAIALTVVSEEVDISVIASEIKEIGELATMECLYTDAGKFSDAKQLFGRNVIFTEKSFIAKWDGSIKAGIKVELVKIELDKVKKEIIIYIPPAEILSHEIDEESIETLDQKDGLFNKVSVEDVREFDAVSKEAMEKRAIENGILDKAYKNAKDIIYRLVYTGVVKEQGYQIIFK